jgi:hypothetical protein
MKACERPLLMNSQHISCKTSSVKPYRVPAAGDYVIYTAQYNELYHNPDNGDILTTCTHICWSVDEMGILHMARQKLKLCSSMIFRSVVWRLLTNVTSPYCGVILRGQRSNWPLEMRPEPRRTGFYTALVRRPEKCWIWRTEENIRT